MRLRPPRTPRTLRPPARRSSSPTLGNSSPNMNSRKYSAGSQKRRRGRTALARSWLSALDNQLTEGRAVSTLCIASELRTGTERLPRTITAAKRLRYAAPLPVATTRDPQRSIPSTRHSVSQRQRCGVISFIPNLASVNCIIINIPDLLFTVHYKNIIIII